MTQGYPADGLQSTQSALDVCLCGGHRSFFWLHLTTFLSSNHIAFSTLTASLPTTWDSGMNDLSLGLLFEGLLSASVLSQERLLSVHRQSSPSQSSLLERVQQPASAVTNLYWRVSCSHWLVLLWTQKAALERRWCCPAGEQLAQPCSDATLPEHSSSQTSGRHAESCCKLEVL